MITTLTERDILVPITVTANVSTFSVATQLTDWASSQDAKPAKQEYLVTERSIRTSDQPTGNGVSPVWLGRVKNRLKEVGRLPINWDSYGAVPLDPRVAIIAEGLIDWFAINDMPPPDVFATSDGGVQLEWHIRRVNIEVEISPFEGTTIHFDDLNGGAPWSRPASPDTLQTARRRLLARQ